MALLSYYFEVARKIFLFFPMLVNQRVQIPIFGKLTNLTHVIKSYLLNYLEFSPSLSRPMLLVAQRFTETDRKNINLQSVFNFPFLETCYIFKQIVISSYREQQACSNLFAKMQCNRYKNEAIPNAWAKRKCNLKKWLQDDPEGEN